MNNKLYVRAYNGVNSRWHRSAVLQRAGRVHAVGMVIEVFFEPVDDAELNAKIDEAYKSRYQGSLYLPKMI